MYNDHFDRIKIDSWDKLSRERLVRELTLIVEDWIEKRPEELFGKLYRLDIDENKIKSALNTTDPCKNIAVLILERQYQKYLSRKNTTHFSHPPEDKDLEW